MSQSTRDLERSGIAGEDMTAKQFYIVQLAADGDIEVGEGATDLLVGVLQNTPDAGEQATYRFLGTSKVKIGSFSKETIQFKLGKLVLTDPPVEYNIDGLLVFNQSFTAEYDATDVELTAIVINNVNNASSHVYDTA